MIKIISYSDKAWAVIGDTKPIKHILKGSGFKFNRNLTVDGERLPGWICSKKKFSHDEINTLLDEPNLQVDEDPFQVGRYVYDTFSYITTTHDFYKIISSTPKSFVITPVGSKVIEVTRSDEFSSYSKVVPDDNGTVLSPKFTTRRINKSWFSPGYKGRLTWSCGKYHKIFHSGLKLWDESCNTQNYFEIH